MAWPGRLGPLLSLCLSIALGGCIGDAANPPSEGNQPQPIHGVWYTHLKPYGYPVERYDFWEYEYRPDGRLMMRDHDFHLDSLTGHLVLDSIKALPQRMTYSLDGEILSESYYHPVSDTLVHIERLQYAIAGDSLSIPASSFPERGRGWRGAGKPGSRACPATSGK